MEVKDQNYLAAIQPSPLDINRAWEFVRQPECGAIHLFTGTTRNHHEGKAVKGLYYDCYESMALKESQKLLSDLIREFDILKAVLFHRTGDVPIGEISLITAISAPHRKPALDATSALIDRIKDKLPVWKKEHYEDHSIWKEELLLKSPEIKPKREKQNPVQSGHQSKRE